MIRALWAIMLVAGIALIFIGASDDPFWLMVGRILAIIGGTLLLVSLMRSGRKTRQTGPPRRRGSSEDRTANIGRAEPLDDEPEHKWGRDQER